MNFNDINIGQIFITDLLPVDRANKCGIVCIEKQHNPNKVIVKRMTSDEQWAIFADKDNNCNMGHWIKV